MTDLVLKSISFAYPGVDKLLIDNLSATFSSGWTGVIGANGCGKTTLMKILSGDLAPTCGFADKAGVSLHAFCPQGTLEPPVNWLQFRGSFQKDVINLKTKLSLHELANRGWEELSHGERKRFQIGCALITRPDLLIVDEPTNHLDGSNRAYVIEALKDFSGIGIVVSHD